MKRLVSLGAVLSSALLPSLGFGADPPKAVGVGEQAPDLSGEVWSDGKARGLTDFRGKIVVLDFWGIWCKPCVHSLPVFEQLRVKYEEKGVVFISVHTPGEEVTKIREVLAREKVKIPFVLDKGRGKDDDRRAGVTGERYGISGYPTVVLVDRAGKVAFRSDDASAIPAAAKLAKEELGIDIYKADSEQFRQIERAFYERQIEQALKRP